MINSAAAKQQQQQKNPKDKFTDTEHRLVIARSWGEAYGMNEMGEECQKIQLPVTNKCWGCNVCNVQYGDHSL